MAFTFPPGFSSPQSIEPTLCFTTNPLKIGEEYPLEKLPVSELVKKDQLLLEFSDTDLGESTQLVRRSVIAGDHTLLSEDGNQVRAEVSGYPRVAFVPLEESDDQQLRVWVEPLFALSPDQMEAAIVIQPLLFNYAILSSEDLYQQLREAGIVFGVDYKQLNLAKRTIRERSTEAEQIVLARGREPIPGTRAYLDFKLEIGPIAGKLLKNGSIDFRERKIMVPVAAGQLIATKVPPSQGKPGMTVLGKRLAQRPGRDIEVETAGDAHYSREEQEVRATKDGVLSVVQDQVIKVFSKLEISGDIDYSTGNIESRNCVVIHGSVFPGFQVKTGGDLEIRGSVTSTQVSSQANVVIKGGVLGNVSAVTASGDIDLNFIEQGRIGCRGNCVIRKQCYYSHIYSGGDIRCHERSTVVGGELIAEGSISLGDAGAPDADPLLLAAGVVAERLFRSRELLQQLEEYESSIVQRLKGYSGVARTKKLRSLKGGIEKMKHRYLRINLIPGTGLYSRPAEESEGGSPRQGAEEEASAVDPVDLGRLSIEVRGTIFAGTRLQIGNRTLTLEQTDAGRRYRLDDSRRHIISLPL
ncbi:DUF342 domain-containing protein [Desulfogranum mediterraneum]|uniref:DUF342 domain-containing protein n=1 Tax=Desulfogranum mediterraneum TaxID=160661 RepID=UPI0003FB9252|nr:FapA family protein [Desulfogranum mediterraneum]